MGNDLVGGEMTETLWCRVGMRFRPKGDIATLDPIALNRTLANKILKESVLRKRAPSLLG